MKMLFYNTRRIFSNICFRIRKLLNLPPESDFRYVDIIFENCNAVRVPARLIERLRLVDIRKTVFTNLCQQFIYIDYCKEFSITIKNDALKIQTSFQKSFDGDEKSSFENHIKSYKDITHIAIKPNRGKRLYIGIPYRTKDENYCANLLQKNKFDEDTFTVSSKE
jgi:hypothetical protein